MSSSSYSLLPRALSLKRKHPYEALDETVEKLTKKSEKSILDLPDNLLVRIADCLDLPTRLKMRANKRLEQLISSSTKLDRIEMEFALDIYDDWAYRVFLLSGDSASTDSITYAPERFDLEALENGLRRWTAHNPAGSIAITLKDLPDRRIGGPLDALFCFQSNELTLDRTSPHITFPPLDFPALLLVAQQTKELTINVHCPSIGEMDLAILRENLLNGDCKLSSFSIAVSPEVRKAYIFRFYGVIVEDRLGAGTRIFKADSNIQLFSTSSSLPSTIMQFREDVVTTIEEDKIRFEKCDETTIATLRASVTEIRLNHAYSMDW